MKRHSQKFLMQRRFYMVLPLLILPFVTMIFWALGGGQVNPVQAHEVEHSGFNPELPGAHFSKEVELWDKFALYEQSKRDSLKYQEARRNDPYYVVSPLKGNRDTLPAMNFQSKLITSLGDKGGAEEIDQHEAMVNRKLEQLALQLDREDDPASGMRRADTSPSESEKRSVQDLGMSEDIDRLERMMALMEQGDVNDPEMRQIDGVLEKILDIQHPERVKEKIRSQSILHKERVFPVQSTTGDDNIALIENRRTGLPVTLPDSLMISDQAVSVRPFRNGFYGLDDNDVRSPYESNAIEAVIHNTQTVVAGSSIKMRLLSDIYINGKLVEKDQFLYGVCSLNGERLNIAINSIRDRNALFPVSLSAYDLDGMEGIYIPGAITRDAAKEATGQSIQDLQLYSMDNSLEVQAATAGLEAAKGLFGKKAKLIRITVKAGYQILLKDSNQLNQ
ncbi:MAG: conjugative transposon protein TraM [Cyclobacteriaceae bacterium]